MIRSTACRPAMLLAASALSLLLALPALAQGSSPPATPAPAGSPGGPRSSASVERHIAELHRDLKITAAQAGPWDAFAQTMRENAQHMDSLYKQRALGFETMNAVDGLRSYEQIAQAHLEDLQKLEPAFATLYASMSEAQKQTADRLFRTYNAKRQGAAGE